MLQVSICYFQNIDFNRALQLNLIQIFLHFSCHCTSRSIPPNMFLDKRREHPCQSVISIKLQSNFIEITLRHGCSPVNVLHIFRTPFSKNTSGWLLPELRMGKLILNHLIWNNCPEFCNGLLGSYFFKLTLESDYVEPCFWRVPVKTILAP